jgi:hypothetical protein
MAATGVVSGYKVAICAYFRQRYTTGTSTLQCPSAR